MIRASATLSIWSETLRPDDISDIIDVVPDDTVVKGSEQDPPRGRPPKHGWHVFCDKRGRDVSANDALTSSWRG